VDQAATDMQAKTKKPQDQKNNENGLKHIGLPFTHAEVNLFTTGRAVSHEPEGRKVRKLRSRTLRTVFSKTQPSAESNHWQMESGSPS
jgi:hypothetical protein